MTRGEKLKHARRLRKTASTWHDGHAWHDFHSREAWQFYNDIIRENEYMFGAGGAGEEMVRGTRTGLAQAHAVKLNMYKLSGYYR